MKRTAVSVKIEDYPIWVQEFIKDSKVYDSSCSKEARVIFIEKDEGYYLKSAPKGSLEAEGRLTEYFHKKGLATEVIGYMSEDKDFLLTKKVHGEDCTYQKYLDDPKRLCDTTATLLRELHEVDFSDCGVDRVKSYIETVENSYRKRHFDNDLTDETRLLEREEAYRIAMENKHLLKNEVLLHGDYCLPNIMLDNWNFSAFIDLGNGGVGDRHIDLFWGAWTLKFNLGTDVYRDRFFDVYGRDKVDFDKLKIVAAMECFG